MKSATERLTRAALLGIALALWGCGTTPETLDATTDLVRRAEGTLANFQKDPDMVWFRNNVSKARAIIISPQVARAGFIFGGSGAEALVLSRDDSGRWHGPAFYNMGVGSVGLQAGIDVSEMVVLVMTEKAVNGLLSPSFKLGADATITAGPVGAGAATTITADMISFVRSKGAFAGVSLEGTVITPDSGANKAFYGKEVTPVDILVRGTVSNPSAARLQEALRLIAR